MKVWFFLPGVAVMWCMVAAQNFVTAPFSDSCHYCTVHWLTAHNVLCAWFLPPPLHYCTAHWLTAQSMFYVLDFCHHPYITAECTDRLHKVRSMCLIFATTPTLLHSELIDCTQHSMCLISAIIPTLLHSKLIDCTQWSMCLIFATTPTLLHSALIDCIKYVLCAWFLLSSLPLPNCYSTTDMDHTSTGLKWI